MVKTKVFKIFDVGSIPTLLVFFLNIFLEKKNQSVA